MMLKNKVDETSILKALSEVFDPEINVNIVDLGLVYNIKFKSESSVTIVMTLTSPTCPFGETLVEQAKSAVDRIDGIENSEIEITFDPPWDYSKLSENAKEELGI